MSQTPMPFAAASSQDALSDEPPTLVANKREPERERSRGRLWPLVLLSLVALALAAYAAVLWQNQQTLRAAIDAAHAKEQKLVAAQQTTQAELLTVRQRAEGIDKELGEAQAALATTQGKLDVLQQEAADADAQVRELKEMAARFQRMIDSGKLEISLRRGRMVVDLPARVLFPSGSAELSEEGKQSLREVAKILRSVRGKRFIVGGHTDNKRLTKAAQAQFSSNWALSAARAVTVTEAMVRAGMHPGRLVAAGYGPHDPVARNRSEKGRQANRRIEIILEPRLRELPKEP